ncbi:MAG: PLP-dependent aminotransferase family protein [Pseudonocardiaceae bacterium]
MREDHLSDEPTGRPWRDSPDLLLILRPTSGRPLWEQLRDALRDAVRTGRLPAGSRLPSSRALAADLGVSRGVVVDAYAQLAAEGYLTSVAGSGTHVAATFQLPRVEPVTQQPPIPAPAGIIEFDLRADPPDLALFPRRKWASATRDAVRDLTDIELGYGDPHGAARLRTELAAYLARTRGAMVDGDSVLIVAGVTQGLTLLGRLLVERGQDTLAVEDPGGRWMQRVAASTGLRLVPVPVDRDGLDVAALAATDVRAVLCTPAHQFPTGAVLSSARRRALVRWAMECDGVVIEDDYNGMFRWDRMPMGCVQGLDHHRVALLGSVSRSLGPGLRLGWAVPPPALLDPLVAAKRDADGGCPVIAQQALARLIEMGAFDRHLRRARRLYRARQDALLIALDQELPEWPVAGAVAGLHVWLQPPGRLDAATLVAAAAARGVAIDVTATTTEAPAELSGLVVGYARLDSRHATEAVARIADAVREVGLRT